MIKKRPHDRFVGLLKSDGKPYKLLSDDDLKELLFDWLRGEDIEGLCLKYHISKIQFYRQKEHLNNVMNELLQEIQYLRHVRNMSTKQMEALLGIPYIKINYIIAKILL